MSRGYTTGKLLLGGAVCGSFLGIFGGGVLGALGGGLIGDVSLGLDGALFAGCVGCLAGALYGGYVALQGYCGGEALESDSSAQRFRKEESAKP